MTALEAQLARERELVEAAKVDPEAFGKLYDLHFGRIYSYAYHRTGNHADAEDVTAQTFQRALEHLSGYQWRGISFSAWLNRIASNLVASHHRNRFPQTDLDEASNLRAHGPLPEDMAVRSEATRELRAVVATLPASQQQALALKFGQGLRNREIGEVMGRSEGAIKQILHRAVLALRERLGPEPALGGMQAP